MGLYESDEKHDSENGWNQSKIAAENFAQKIHFLGFFENCMGNQEPTEHEEDVGVEVTYSEEDCEGLHEELVEVKFAVNWMEIDVVGFVTQEEDDGKNGAGTVEGLHVGWAGLC